MIGFDILFAYVGLIISTRFVSVAFAFWAPAGKLAPLNVLK